MCKRLQQPRHPNHDNRPGWHRAHAHPKAESDSGNNPDSVSHPDTNATSTPGANSKAKAHAYVGSGRA